MKPENKENKDTIEYALKRFGDYDPCDDIKSEDGSDYCPSRHYSKDGCKRYCKRHSDEKSESECKPKHHEFYDKCKAPKYPMDFLYPCLPKFNYCLKEKEDCGKYVTDAESTGFNCAFPDFEDKKKEICDSLNHMLKSLNAEIAYILTTVEKFSSEIDAKEKEIHELTIKCQKIYEYIENKNKKCDAMDLEQYFCAIDKINVMIEKLNIEKNILIDLGLKFYKTSEKRFCSIVKQRNSILKARDVFCDTEIHPDHLVHDHTYDFENIYVKPKCDKSEKVHEELWNCIKKNISETVKFSLDDEPKEA